MDLPAPRRRHLGDRRPGHREEVAFGITRTLDVEALPGPGTAYSTPYFKGGSEYSGPYSDPDTGTTASRWTTTPAP